jgi:hypothetical protein
LLLLRCRLEIRRPVELVDTFRQLARRALDTPHRRRADASVEPD